MRHLRKVKCGNCGSPPRSEESVCEVCFHSVWLWHCDRHGLPAEEERGCKECGYLFDGKMYFAAAELAVALGCNWNKARGEVQANRLDEWADAGLTDHDLAARLRRCTGEAARHPDQALAGVVAFMNPDGRLWWCGRAVTRDDFMPRKAPGDFQNVEIAKMVLNSGLSDWLADVPTYRWLAELREQCRRRATILGLTEFAAATPSHWWWLLAGSDALQHAAAKLKTRYVSAKDSELTLLICKDALTEDEALTLAAAPEEKLLTVEAAWRELVALSIPTLSDFEKAASERPCSRMHLEEVERELEGFLELLRKQREQLRPRQADLPDPPELTKATGGVRTVLSQSFAAHDRAQAEVRQLRQIVARGHIQQAVTDVSTVQRTIAGFSDLSLDFVRAAEVQYKRHRRRLFAVGIILGVGILLAATLIELLRRANVLSP